jgi:hypothetical protein
MKNIAGLAEHHIRDAEGFCVEEHLRGRLFCSAKINADASAIWPLLNQLRVTLK